MNAADQALIRWLERKIRAGVKEVVIPTELLESTTEEGVKEARSLAKICGVRIRAVSD